MFIFVVGVSIHVACPAIGGDLFLGGQDEYEILEAFFGNVGLSFAENVVSECFTLLGQAGLLENR